MLGLGFRAAAIGACALAGAGCRAFENHRSDLAMLHAGGRYDIAATLLDEPGTTNLYGRRNRALYQMDRGAIALALDDDAGAIEALESAERAVETQRRAAADDVLAKWTINDAASTYVAEPYEDMYLNVLKLLAQLERGTISGGASVEARRLAAKADTLRDLYVRYDNALNEQGAGDLPATPSSSLVMTNPRGEFLESPLGVYLSAITFLEDGDREFQAVAERRLRSAIELQRTLQPEVDPQAFAGVGALAPDDVDLLVVALSGRGPSKTPYRIGPIPIGTVPVYLELPELIAPIPESRSARLEIEGAEPVPLALVEDLSATAIAHHQRLLPMIYSRTLLRYALKAGVSVALTEAARRSVSDQDQGLVQVLGVIGGMAALMATEKADLRCWAFLPGQARVAALNLDPGEHRVRVTYLGAGGGELYSTPWRTVDIKPDGLTTIVEHFWR